MFEGVQGPVQAHLERFGGGHDWLVVKQDWTVTEMTRTGPGQVDESQELDSESRERHGKTLVSGKRLGRHSVHSCVCLGEHKLRKNKREKQSQARRTRAAAARDHTFTTSGFTTKMNKISSPCVSRLSPLPLRLR